MCGVYDRGDRRRGQNAGLRTGLEISSITVLDLKITGESEDQDKT